MRYRIEYSIKRHCDFAENRTELVKILTRSQPGTIADVRKLYKNGASDSVIETYRKALNTF